MPRLDRTQHPLTTPLRHPRETCRQEEPLQPPASRLDIHKGGCHDPAGLTMGMSLPVPPSEATDSHGAALVPTGMPQCHCLALQPYITCPGSAQPGQREPQRGHISPVTEEIWVGCEDLCHFGITVQTLPAHAVKLSLEDPDPCQPWLCLQCHNASHHLLLASGSSPQHSQPSNQELPFRSGILRAAATETAPGWSTLRAARMASKTTLKPRSAESLSTAGHPQMSCLGHS